MNRLLIFAGTTEGRELAEYLERWGFSCDICVATEYGEALLDPAHTIHTIRAGRLDADGMRAYMRQRGITHVVDGTHPYAQVVSANIAAAAGETDCRYYRLLRSPSKEIPGKTDTAVSGGSSGICYFDTIDQAAAWLDTTSGGILAATGSKELYKYTRIADYRERVFARILSVKESMDQALSLGFQGSHLICMQGPFTQELNTAMLRQTGARYLVTKESGKTGGFPEKQQAAADAGAVLVVIGRPPENAGFTPEEIRRILCREFDLHPCQEISVIGIGMGTPQGMTREAWEECRSAQVLIGARRMLQAAEELEKPTLEEYRGDVIKSWLLEHPEYEKAAVLLSGDVGFYSGAQALTEAFCAGTDGSDTAGAGRFKVSFYPGISSVVSLCAKLHTSWEDVRLVSVHGRSSNVIAAVRENRKVFVLTGKQESFRQLCAQLEEFKLGSVQISAGCMLSYPEEKIFRGTPGELKNAPVSDLTALLIENPGACRRMSGGLPDELFIRGKVPMTKSEVRAVSLSRLDLKPDSIIYDVGAGTGSVSVEMALLSPEGSVYAIEHKAEAADLIRENRRLFGVPNLTVVEGRAPEAMEQLPAPTHAFIGGSSGNMEQILRCLLRKNPGVRIVINAIALETIAQTMRLIDDLSVADTDVTAITAARAKEVGGFHMMMGQNPVYIISFTGRP